MPPKKATVEELIAALSDKLDELTTQQNKRFDDMEEMMKKIKEENTELKTTVSNLETENKSLKCKLNKLEQHSRRNNIRVFGFDIEGDDRNCDAVIDQLYTRALLPVLQGALSKGRLTEIPGKDKLIQSAHVLPGKEGKAKPIIVRLVNNFYRTVLLQCKREFAPKLTRATRTVTADPARLAPLRYPMFEDVSPETYRFLQQLIANSSIGAAWVAGGVIRYKLAGSEIIHRVGSIFDPIEKLLAV